MNVGHFKVIVEQFNRNWTQEYPEFSVAICGNNLQVPELHPLKIALKALCAGEPTSLPFFKKNSDAVVWCTLGGDPHSLRKFVASLNDWIIPSFGGLKSVGDGYIDGSNSPSDLVKNIFQVSPAGYYRWSCPRQRLQKVCEKLRQRHFLVSQQPERTRPHRYSLYELRSRFAASLLSGDRGAAEESITILDSLQLETAVNTQLMRIRMWYQFREYEKIRNYSNLSILMEQPLPERVRSWINEVLGVDVTDTNQSDETLEEGLHEKIPAEILDPVTYGTKSDPTWGNWFKFILTGEPQKAEQFLEERSRRDPSELCSEEINNYAAGLDEFFIDDALRERERVVIAKGVSEFIDEFVREPDFPRPIFSALYLGLLRVWAKLYSGNSSGEYGHVFLELAGAVLRLGSESGEVRLFIEEWWNARKSVSQLPFTLDAVELLLREYPDRDPVMGLWINAVDFVKRDPEALVASEKMHWRRVGARLGVDQLTIEEYLPTPTETEEKSDPLEQADIKHVAIVCMREKQANDAAEQVKERTGAKVTLVTGKTAGRETDQAQMADVVLVVWMATSHAVFRAFDKLHDRAKTLYYVQGTGSSSIVRSLERWATTTA